MSTPVLVAVVVGGGKMGGEIAPMLACGGWRVHVVEPDAQVRAGLRARALGTAKLLGAPRASAGRVLAHAALESVPWREVALVIEAAPERLAVKRALFARIEALAPARTIITTNSSSLRVTDIATVLDRPARAAALHFLAPVAVVPLVEIVRGEKTGAATIRRLNQWMQALGRMPVNLARDVPGMLVNRVQHAMMREIVDLIDRGVVTVDDVDRAVRFGFGFRLAVCGPLRQRDLNGLLIHLQSAEQIYPDLASGKRPGRMLARLVAAGHTGARAGRGFHRWDRSRLAAETEAYERRVAAALALALADVDGAGTRSRRSRG